MSIQEICDITQHLVYFYFGLKFNFLFLNYELKLQLIS